MGRGAANGVNQNSDAGLNQSISTLVCAANMHREADTENNVPFCVANVDRDEDTTYQLIGFGDICKNPEYKLQGHLSSKNVGGFVAANWPKIGNAQFREVALIPCSELGLEEYRGLSLIKVGTPVTIGLVISAVLFIKKVKDGALVISMLGAAASAIMFLVEWQTELTIEDAKRKKIHDLISGVTAVEKK